MMNITIYQAPEWMKFKLLKLTPKIKSSQLKCYSNFKMFIWSYRWIKNYRLGLFDLDTDFHFFSQNRYDFVGFKPIHRWTKNIRTSKKYMIYTVYCVRLIQCTWNNQSVEKKSIFFMLFFQYHGTSVAGTAVSLFEIAASKVKNS